MYRISRIQILRQWPPPGPLFLTRPFASRLYMEGIYMLRPPDGFVSHTCTAALIIRMRLPLKAFTFERKQAFLGRVLNAMIAGGLRPLTASTHAPGDVLVIYLSALVGWLADRQTDEYMMVTEHRQRQAPLTNSRQGVVCGI
jgi:hypothetical protein